MDAADPIGACDLGSAGWNGVIVFHIHDRPVGDLPPSRILSAGWTAIALPLREIDGVAAADIRHCVVDVDLAGTHNAVAVRSFMARAAPPATRIFACPRGDHHAQVQAWSLGATVLVNRPVEDHTILAVLTNADQPRALDDEAVSAVVATVALDGAFRAIMANADFRNQGLSDVADELDRDIRAMGVAAWLNPIRAHHIGTYQHCLLVTGLASSFGQELGLSERDRSTLTTAALLHDIGKGRIDAAILDKPSRLTDEERAIVEQHPALGERYLRRKSSVAADVLDVVRHHHEYLDGSGYPDGLSGSQISDLTRLVTIADVFGALIERRAYRPPMLPSDAYGILIDMVGQGRIEPALVRAFEPVVKKLAS